MVAGQCGSGIDDIEEIASLASGVGLKPSAPVETIPGLPETSLVGSTVRNRLKNGGIDLKLYQADSFVPGTKSIYMKTWGCSHNSSDSEYMAGILDAAGYKLTKNEGDADLWILNSCTVKTPAEMHLQHSVDRGLKAEKAIVVAGCVSQAAPTTPWLKGLSLIGVQQIDRVLEVVEETLKGNSVRLLGRRKDAKERRGGAPLTLPKIRKNPLIEILAINTGCLNHCMYCKTKQARGDLTSYSVDELVARARQSFAEGVKELWLTSEDLGAYGHDLDIRLPDLLRPLVDVIPSDCMMRMGMTNPPYILDHLAAIAETLRHPRVYAFIHIPVQAGSDRVLDDMRREYTNADFRRVCDYLREHVPGISIATDLICGFPTETAEDFEETLDLVRDYKFPSLFINQYFPRPNTPSARMKRIDTVEVKRRTKAATEIFRSYTTYDPKLGQEFDVLITEEAHDKEHWVGHNKYYDQVLVPKLPELLGQWARVRIVGTSKHSMVGQLVDGGHHGTFYRRCRTIVSRGSGYLGLGRFGDMVGRAVASERVQLWAVGLFCLLLAVAMKWFNL